MTVRYFKTATELAFYFCWAVYISTLINGADGDINALACMLVLIGALILNLPDILSVKNKFLRAVIHALGLALPALSLTRGFQFSSVLLLLFPYAYFVFVYYTDRQGTEREEFIHRFKIMGWALLPILLLVFSIDNTIRVKALQAIYPYILLFIVCGFLSLQNLRWAGNTHGKALEEKRQFAELLFFCILAAFISLTDYIERINTWLINSVIYPFLEAVYGGMIVGIYRFIMTIRDLIHEDNPVREKEYTEFVESFSKSKDMMPETPPPVNAPAAEVVQNNTQYILVGILLLIAILVLLLSKRKRNRPISYGNELREQLEPEKKQGKKRKKASSDTVRGLYALYMKKAYAKEKPSRSITTEDIEERAHSLHLTDADAAAVITEKYRDARYDDKLSGDDVKKLKKLIKK